MKQIEDASVKDGQYLSPVPGSAAITIMPEQEYGYLTLLRLILHTYPRRAVLGGTLMITQSFLYNAIFFTYADAAQAVNAQLIVLAARRGIASVLGTVSQYVLRNAPCPVLTVPE
jgi:hypothetical protein